MIRHRLRIAAGMAIGCAGLLLVTCVPLATEASAASSGTATIISPSDGTAVFGGPTFTVDVSPPAGTDVICVTVNTADGTQAGYTCDSSTSTSYSVTADQLPAGVQEVTATAQTSGNNIVSAPIQVDVNPGAFHPLTPQRVLDTRTGSGAVTSDGTTDVFPSDAGVPSSATAVVFNLTETQPTAGGFVTAYPSGTNRPLASNLNFTRGQTVANLVTVGGGYGDVTLYNGSSGTVQLIADVVGYYDAGGASAPSSAGHFVGLPPSRILDTRAGFGRPGTAPLPPNGVATVAVAGHGGVPSSGATGVVFTLTETQARSVGNFGAYPPSAGSTETSSLNFTAGHDVANLVELPLDASGKVDIRNSSPGTSHAIMDVVGYYTGAPASPSSTGLIDALPPQRILDTRYGVGAPQGAIPAGGSVSLSVADLLKLPSQAQSAVPINLTETGASTLGYLTAYPAGSARPTASTVNFGAGQTVAAATLADLGSNGSITIYNGSAGPVNVIVDAAGFFS